MSSNDEIHDALVSAGFDPAALGSVLVDVRGRAIASFLDDLQKLSKQTPELRFLPTEDDDDARALVLIHSPPPLIVWRVLDRAARYGSQDPAIAYTEHAPGIWIEIGFRHPNIEQVQASPGQIVLVRTGCRSEAIADGDFSSGWIELAVQPAQAQFHSQSSSVAIHARLRLVADPHAATPCLWVLRNDALTELTSYCRSTHQQLLTRFSVAASASAGVPCVVLRDATGKGPLPLFVGRAIEFQRLHRLRNVHVPAGYRLAPPIRRDAILQSLGVDSDRIAWLHPLGGDSFQVESLPESAFRPLSNWVDYKLADRPRILAPWGQSHSWALTPFIEPTDREKRATLPASSHVSPLRPSEGLLSRTLGWLRRFRKDRLPTAADAAPGERSVPVDEAAKTALDQGHRLHLARPETASAAIERCRTLEAQLLRVLSESKSDVQPEMWAELAAAYDAARNHADAAMCWLQALWGQTDPSPLWAWGWLRSEAKAARPEVRTIDPAPWLSAPASPGTTRAMAAWVLWASLQKPVPAVLSDRAAELQARLLDFEHWLPVRAAWLARTATSRAGSADVLALARTRDRLSERLRIAGLSLELDTPSFLRFAGEGMREQFEETRHWLVDKRDAIHQWIARLSPPSTSDTSLDHGSRILRGVGLEPNVSQTRAYADLMLAWGLTRFAEYSAADAIRKQASASLPADQPVHAILLDAFDFRIMQLREGRTPGGPLPTDVLNRIARHEGQGRYAIDKLREESRILEPTVRISAYDAAVRQPSDKSDSLLRAVDSMPAERLNAEISTILANSRGAAGELVCRLLDRDWELPETAMMAIFDALPRSMHAARNDSELLAKLFKRGFSAASRWDRIDVARELTSRFVQRLDAPRFLNLAETAAAEAIRCLRRLGLRSDVEQLLNTIASRVLQSQPIGRLRVVQPAEWPRALRVLLQVAAGWYSTGNEDEAHKVLDEARLDLLAKTTTPVDRTRLVIAYIAALSPAPARIRLGRLEEIFQSVHDIKREGSTNEYYALSPLLIIEAAVRSAIAADFAISPQVRAWLDADEMAVRRRIRDELKEVLKVQEI
jgi:cellulose synthase operon protein C